MSTAYRYEDSADMRLAALCERWVTLSTSDRFVTWRTLSGAERRAITEFMRKVEPEVER